MPKLAEAGTRLAVLDVDAEDDEEAVLVPEVVPGNVWAEKVLVVRMLIGSPSVEELAEGFE